MSDFIRHECGIALVRLLKPLEYYQEKYGSALYGLDKIKLLMQKQRNRGQDGAGLASIKLKTDPGKKYINRLRTNSVNYLDDLFNQVFSQFEGLTPEQIANPAWLKENRPFAAELLLGHLRYGTHSDNSVETCHPLLRENNWITRNLILAGNFNLTNTEELFEELVNLGQYPREKSDTITILEKIGHFLDDEVQRLHTWFKPDGHNNVEINDLIFENLDIQRLLKRACKKFDGGYVMAGLIGHGDAFVMRDPNGIRPAYYFHDDEVVAVASERPALQTSFNVHANRVHELSPGHVLTVKFNGKLEEKPFADDISRKSCSFERIYFSRGTDRDIYQERKKLGYLLAEPVLKAVNYDFKHTVFSFVPNTAESAFLGLIEGIRVRLNEIKREKILELGNDFKPKKLEKILSLQPRAEKLIVKDEKLRTFITNDTSRSEVVSHAYDVTYGVVENEKDTVVLLDDSIVRGTTIKNSLIMMVARLRPKQILIVSSAPQIRYPDCYGIDMSKLKDFIAFKAMVELLKDRKQESLLQEAYVRCKAQIGLPKEQVTNELIALYSLFTDEEISKKIAEIVTPVDIKPKVEVLYQTIPSLHEACPNHTGDWYFSGIYPTPGGNKVVNKAFINYMENRDERAY